MSIGNSLEQELGSRDARLDFENVLQGILEKANAEERLNSDQEEERDSSNEDTIKGQKTIASPQKPSTPKSGKKRRKREEQRDEAQKASPYIMKLFDRSVDLASFTDQTPLYPICRAWMKNDPHSKNAYLFLNGANHSDDEDSSATVNKIPRPNDPWNNIDENGKYKSPRIPNLLPQPSDNFDKCLTNRSEAPSRDVLLVSHLQHWKKVRQTWKAKSGENELRYKDGMTMLLDIFSHTASANSASQ